MKHALGNRKMDQNSTGKGGSESHTSGALKHTGFNDKNPKTTAKTPAMNAGKAN